MLMFGKTPKKKRFSPYYQFFMSQYFLRQFFLNVLKMINRGLNIRLQRDQDFSIPGFPGWDFAKSQDPGIFRDGISLKFYPGIFTKKVRDLSGFPSQRIDFVNFIHLEDFFACKIQRQRSHPFHPVARSKSERVFSVAGDVVTQKRGSFHQRKQKPVLLSNPSLVC